MYFYSAPFIIIKEKDYYRVLDQLGGRYKLDTNTLLTALSVIGKKWNPKILDSLKTKLGIKDADKRLSSLVENAFLLTSKHRRKDPFNYKKVKERIINNNSKEKDILNLGTLTLASIKYCPYSCAGCYVNQTNEENSSEISLDKLKLTIEDAIIMGVNHLTLSGGEITSSQKSAERTAFLSKFARSKGLDSITVVTTGYQLENFLDFFMDAGVTEFQISIDGFENYNDNYKNANGATERSFRAIEICKEKNVNYMTNTVVSKRNIHFISNFVTELVNKGVSRVRLSKIITNHPNLKIDAEKSKLLEGMINKLKEKHKININGPFGNPYIIDDYINCVAGKLYAHIDYSGSVLPCAFMPDRIVGNIDYERLINIWNLNNPILKQLSEGSKLSSKCNKCAKRYHCFGNCVKDYEFKRGNCKNE
ncbi:MAG: radical SAM protein [Nanoarchaeota archaeon]|nr:radical SAM protein [Nanoarchaeota archaeon]